MVHQRGHFDCQITEGDAHDKPHGAGGLFYVVAEPEEPETLETVERRVDQEEDGGVAQEEPGEPDDLEESLVPCVEMPEEPEESVQVEIERKEGEGASAPVSPRSTESPPNPLKRVSASRELQGSERTSGREPGEKREQTRHGVLAEGKLVQVVENRWQERQVEVTQMQTQWLTLAALCELAEAGYQEQLTPLWVLDTVEVTQAYVQAAEPHWNVWTNWRYGESKRVPAAEHFGPVRTIWSLPAQRTTTAVG